MSVEGDDYKPHQWFAWTLTDFISTMTLGTISTLSSALILLIIYKSPVQLKSTYHRIMALLSSCNICLSAPLALATIPIPKSLVPYEGPTLGTDGTCIAQGVFMTFGANAIADATLCLAGYYVCIALRVNNWRITRIYEPMYFTYIICGNLIATVLIAKSGHINIRYWSTYCGPTPIPPYCYDVDAWIIGMVDDTSVEVDLSNCEWPDEPHEYLTMERVFKYYILAVSFFLVVAMLLVIFVVCMMREQDSEDEGDPNGSDDENSNDADAYSDEHLKQTRRLVVRQAVMHILAFFLTWIFVIIPWEDASSPKMYNILESVLLPLGGFWNMLIFVHIKILLVRESNPVIDSNFKAFMVLLIKKPNTTPEVVLSSMEYVVVDNSNEEAGIGIDDGDHLGEEGEESSRSTFTPSDASQGISMETSQQWKTDDENHALRNNQNVTTLSSVRNVPPTITILSGSKESEISSITIVNNEAELGGGYKYYPEIAVKFKKKVGLLNNDDRHPSNDNADASVNSVILDDLSNSGLSMGAPSYGGLSTNDMQVIMEDDDQE